jgi:hypothetical protein
VRQTGQLRVANHWSASPSGRNVSLNNSMAHLR